MKYMHKTIPVFFVVLLLFVVVVGAFTVSLSENGYTLINTKTASTETAFNVQSEPTMPLEIRASPTSSDQLIAITETPNTIVLLSPTPEIEVVCSIKSGWVPVIVGAEETVRSLADKLGVRSATLLEGNCLISENQIIPQDSIVYLPPLATPTASIVVEASGNINTPTPIRCGPPPGWIVYRVQKDDNLYRLGLAFGVSVFQLQFANCLDSDYIYTGQNLYVPNVPTRIPPPTRTSAPTATIIPSSTSTPLASLEPTGTLTDLPPTMTSTESPTVTPVPATETPVASITPTVQLTTEIPPVSNTLEPSPTTEIITTTPKP